MTDFNTLFPNFISQCVQLKQLLTPIAFVLLVGGTISTILTGQRTGNGYMRVFVRLIILAVVLTFLVSWGNTITTIVDSTVKNVLHVDPTQIYDQYQNALSMQKSGDTASSWWEKVFSIRATIFESLVSAFLWLLGLVASAIVFYAYIIQKLILYMGYALAPIFVGFLAFGSLFDIAKRYFLNLVGVMIWPLGWGVAGLVTQGLIDFMTDRSFLHTSVTMIGVIPATGSDVYNFQNFLGAGLLGIWLIFSTIAAPIIIGRSISYGSLAGSHLIGGAAQAGRAGVTTAATTGASVAAGGGGWAAAAGAIVGAGAGLESLVTSSAEMGSGSLISSLVAMRPRSNTPRNGAGAARRDGKNGGQGQGGGGPTPAPPPVANPPFASDDLTGDKAVAEIMRKAKKDSDEQ